MNDYSIGKEPFQIILPKDAFGKNDVIVGNKFQVINESKPYRKIVKSKYKIVNWFRKKFNYEKIETGYCYDVKMIK